MWWFGFHFSHTRVRVSVAPQLLGGLAAELQQAAPRPAGRARGLPRRHPSSGVQLGRRVTNMTPRWVALWKEGLKPAVPWYHFDPPFFPFCLGECPFMSIIVPFSPKWRARTWVHTFCLLIFPCLVHVQGSQKVIAFHVQVVASEYCHSCESLVSSLGQPFSWGLNSRDKLSL